MQSIQPNPPANAFHVPVMLHEVLEDLAIERAGKFLDCTVGLGGHAAEALEAAPRLQLCGLDRDSQALAVSEEKLKIFGDRVHLFHCSYADFGDALKNVGWDVVDAMLLDLGVSSLQLDTPERGFSFRHNGPLDMRMDQYSDRNNAWHYVNRTPLAELRDCFAIYGEEPQAGRIARAIVNARQKKTIDDTLELAEIIRMAYPPAWRVSARRHPATRCFQAIRMAVNDELGQLKSFLQHSLGFLAKKGRLAIISFHSLEDRLVKHTFRSWAERGLVSLIHKKPLVPDPCEIEANPRSASAKLRAVICMEQVNDAS